MSYKLDINEYYCLNIDCSEYKKMGNGNLFIKEYKGKNNKALLMCRTCGKCFCETHGTPFFRLKTPVHEIATALALIPELGSIRAVARYTNHKPDTIFAWIELVNSNINDFNDYFSKNLHYSQNRIDRLWSYIEQRKRASNNKKIVLQR